jgi:hypothetical protein
MNDDLGGMWKEVVMTYFKVLYRHFPGVLRKAGWSVTNSMEQSHF